MTTVKLLFKQVGAGVEKLICMYTYGERDLEMYGCNRWGVRGGV